MAPLSTLQVTSTLRAGQPLQISRSHALQLNPHNDDDLWKTLSKQMSKPLPSLCITPPADGPSNSKNTNNVPSTSCSAPHQSVPAAHRMEIPCVIISSSSEDMVSSTWHRGDPINNAGLIPPATSRSRHFNKHHNHSLPQTRNRLNKPLPTLPPTSVVALIELMELMEAEMVREVQRVQESIRELRKDLGEYRAERRRAERRKEERLAAQRGNSVDGEFWMVN